VAEPALPVQGPEPPGAELEREPEPELEPEPEQEELQEQAEALELHEQADPSQLEEPQERPPQEERAEAEELLQLRQAEAEELEGPRPWGLQNLQQEPQSGGRQQNREQRGPIREQPDGQTCQASSRSRKARCQEPRCQRGCCLNRGLNLAQGGAERKEISRPKKIRASWRKQRTSPTRLKPMSQAMLVCGRLRPRHGTERERNGSGLTGRWTRLSRSGNVRKYSVEG